MERKVEVISERDIFKVAIFTLKQAELRYEQFDGQMSPAITRISFERGDAAAALLHDPATGRVLLVEQFRYPTLSHGNGWLVELPAGVVDEDETGQPELTMRRELIEETGYHVTELRPVLTFYTSPGGSSERIFLFYGHLQPDGAEHTSGGLVAEAEDIRIFLLTLDEALARVDRGEIADAKTILALQWLQLHPEKSR